MTIVHDTSRPLSEAEKKLARSMVLGMARQARAAHPDLDPEALLAVLVSATLRLPGDHLAQRWLSEDAERETCWPLAQHDIDELIAARLLEQHPSDPDRYRWPEPAGTPWE